VAARTKSRISNTFISASAEEESDGQISSAQFTLAKQHTEGDGNVAFIYLTGSFKAFGNIRKSSTLQGLKQSYSDFQSFLFASPFTCNIKDSNLMNVLNRFFF